MFARETRPKCFTRCGAAFVYKSKFLKQIKLYKQMDRIREWKRITFPT